MYHTIYKITNMVNGKIYIGAHTTDNLDDGYMGSGKLLIRAQTKYGIENFIKEILEIFDNPEQMFEMEAKIVNEEFVKRKNTYNIKKGGFGGFTKEASANGGIQTGINIRKGLIEHSCKGRKLSEETKIKIGKTVSRSLKDKYANGEIINGFKNKKHSVGTKKIIGYKSSINQKGVKNSQYGKCWIYRDDEKISIMIYKEYLEQYINYGWKKGRKIKFN